jgi:hypothetical protein
MRYYRWCDPKPPEQSSLASNYAADLGLRLVANDAEWRMRQAQLSPRYTTRWKEISKVRMNNSI